MFCKGKPFTMKSLVILATFLLEAQLVVCQTFSMSPASKKPAGFSMSLKPGADRVLADIGNTVYRVGSKIRPQSPGVYIFHFQGLTANSINDALLMNLYHNGRFICSMWGGYGVYMSASNTVALRLQVNDTIDIRIYGGYSDFHEDKGDIYGQFTGYKIAE